MLVWDAERLSYDANATPETGTQTLFAFCETLIAEDGHAPLVDHSVF
ncbi:hypothetical protein ABMC88_16505 [Sulfitobacter sp. HNIBRBA2951]